MYEISIIQNCNMTKYYLNYCIATNYSICNDYERMCMPLFVVNSNFRLNIIDKILLCVVIMVVGAVSCC